MRLSDTCAVALRDHRKKVFQRSHGKILAPSRGRRVAAPDQRGRHARRLGADDILQLIADVEHRGCGTALMVGERLEACPMAHEEKRSTAGLFVGPKRVFVRAGFKTVIERKAGRPLVRLDLKAAKAAPKSAGTAKQ